MKKEEISELVMQQFKDTNSKVGHVLNWRWVSNILMKKLNPKEKELVTPAINYLIEKEFLEITNPDLGESVALTQEGFDYIYPESNNQAINSIQKALMDKFYKDKSKINHVIQFKWILNILMRNLNPKEQTLVEEAIHGLVDKGYITVENRNGMDCLVLTKDGFDYIYD